MRRVHFSGPPCNAVLPSPARIVTVRPGGLVIIARTRAAMKKGTLTAEGCFAGTARYTPPLRERTGRLAPDQRFAISFSIELLSPRKGGPDTFRLHSGRSGLVPVSPTSSGAASFARLVAIPAEDRAISAWLKWNSRWLTAAGTNHRCAMGWCRTITGASPTLFALLCLTARLAALGGRITAFLEERLISSGERKILPTIAASELHISGHGKSSSRLYTGGCDFCIRKI